MCESSPKLNKSAQLQRLANTQCSSIPVLAFYNTKRRAALTEHSPDIVNQQCRLLSRREVPSLVVLRLKHQPTHGLQMPAAPRSAAVDVRPACEEGLTFSASAPDPWGSTRRRRGWTSTGRGRWSGARSRSSSPCRSGPTQRGPRVRTSRRRPTRALSWHACAPVSPLPLSSRRTERAHLRRPSTGTRPSR